MPIQITCPSCKSRFNAPDAAAGKRTKCPKCSGVIEIPVPAPKEEIFDAEEEFRSPFTDEDFEKETPPLPATDGDRKPCPMCGEMIQKNAVKCRHCGEVFDPVLKKQQKKAKSKSSQDEDLSTVEYIVAILCGFIGCIIGIVWMIQGKPKGQKMVMISIIANICWAVLRAALVALSGGQN